jgi:hypothetical protein
MQLLIRIVLVYFAAAAALVALVRDNPLASLVDVILSLPASLGLFVSIAWWVFPLIGATVFFVPRRIFVERLARAIVAVFAATAFFLTFTMVKASLPMIVPFWADPMFADIDKALHFGQDPWALSHVIAPWVNVDLAGQVYFTYWVAPAMFLPVYLFLFDADAARVRRFIWLYAFVWIVLGNLLAVVFMSAGPVFYDRLLDSTRFVGLDTALAQFREGGAQIGYLQEKLWASYVSGVQEAGSGISAFPSVHLGMITVIALYLADRWPRLAPVSVGLVAIYEFLSVFLGWHYAVDGYASIALVAGVWGLLRRRVTAAGALPAAAE